MSAHNTYRELLVWQRAIAFSVLIYRLTESFPKEEVYGLTSQLRRASVSIASNVAEGQKRGSSKEFVQFLRIAYGSCAEIDSQLEIACQIGFFSHLEHEKINIELLVIMKMLKKLMISIAH